MDVTTAVRTRRMCRRFDPARALPDDVVDGLLDLATRAPSAGHAQGWEFVVLSTAAQRDAFWEATSGPPGRADPWLRGVRAAPVLIVVLSDPAAYLDRYAEPDKGWTDRSLDRWPVPYWDTDAAMAAMILLLAAQERGLGALFFGVPAGAVSGARSSLGIPQTLRIVGVVALGHPDPDTPTPRSPSLSRGRRRLGDVVHRGRYDAV
jgi:nitroreductase